MLGKLIKYDFISINKSLMVIYLLSVLSTLIVLIAGSFYGDVAIATEAIAKDFAIICLLIALIVPFFNCFFRIKNSLYKNEGYLTNTLPVKRGILFDAKIITSIMTLLISWIIFVSCFMSSFSGMNIIKLFINVVNDSNMLTTSIEMLSLILSELLFIFMCFVFGLVIGYSFDERKDLITFIVGVLVYIICRFTIVFLIEKFNLDYYLYMSLAFLILNILLFFISRYKFKKGVNLE